MTSPTITPEEIDALLKLEREATAGPWTAQVMGGVSVGELRENTRRFAAGGAGQLFEIEPESAAYDYAGLDEESAAERALTDERFIVALRNAAPELLRLASRALQVEPVVEAYLRSHEEVGDCLFCTAEAPVHLHDDDCPLVVAGLITRTGERIR